MDRRILEAATHLLLMRGFEQMTVDAVASRAGVGKATVYRRWARKEDLATAALEQLYGVTLTAGGSREGGTESGGDPDTGSLRGDLIAMYRTVLVFASSPTGSRFLQTSVEESARDPRVAQMHVTAGARWHAHAMAAYTRAQERGEVRLPAETVWVAQSLWGLLILHTLTGKEPPPPSAAESLADLVVRAMSN